MSEPIFICGKCGEPIYESSNGFLTGCKHFSKGEEEKKERESNEVLEINININVKYRNMPNLGLHHT